MQLGSWLKVNGEGIYKSKPWRVQNDSVTEDVWYVNDIVLLHRLLSIVTSYSYLFYDLIGIRNEKTLCMLSYLLGPKIIC